MIFVVCCIILLTQPVFDPLFQSTVGFQSLSLFSTKFYLIKSPRSPYSHFDWEELTGHAGGDFLGTEWIKTGSKETPIYNTLLL